MKRVLIGLLLACLILALIVSCGKRENPVRERYLYRDPWRLDRVFGSLQNNILRDPPIKDVYVYLPSFYDPNFHTPQLLQQGFSVLYLLHDFGGDYSTFAGVHKIGQLADRLIAEEQIQPMIIVMPDAYSLSVGGSFYTNSTLIGKYENYIAAELMAVIDSNFHTYLDKPEDVFIPNPDFRAISGLGMGGYGALRIAIDHDTLFRSVSAMSPYASLESFFSEGIIEKIFEENGIAPGDYSYSSYKSLSPDPDDQNPDKTFTQVVFAMAASFSPHDPNDPDTLQFFELRAEGGKRYGVDLPFDSTRTVKPGSAIWNGWILHDVKNRLANDPAGFGSLKIYLECGDENELGLLEGSRTLDQLLSLYGIQHEYREYSGYPGLPAGQDDYIYDRLEEILKFHSRNFPPPAYRR
jgi:S-formylglutathione hydrolase FrmB